MYMNTCNKVDAFFKKRSSRIVLYWKDRNCNVSVKQVSILNLIIRFSIIKTLRLNIGHVAGVYYVKKEKMFLFNFKHYWLHNPMM